MRILVASDLSAAADLALREAAALAASPADALAAVHVLPRFHRTSIMDPRTTEVVRARIGKVIEVAELFVEVGPAYAEIVRRAEAWQADILVIAGHGQSGIARVLGSVAERVVRHAHCPVLVVRPASGPGPVLAATDLSEPSLPAIAAAAVEARRRGAPLHVVHAIGFLEVEATYLAELASPTIDPRPDGAAALRELKEAVARLGVEAGCTILDAPAAAAIAREAEAIGAALVVVGTHGRTGLARLALGSVAERVVHIAPCSVLVARGRT